MHRGSRRSTAPPPQPPANATEGAARVRAVVMKLFDRQDGNGANWRLLAESLFRAGFEALTRLPEDQKRVLAINKTFLLCEVVHRWPNKTKLIYLMR
jgi:hypothetical protein